MTRRHLRKLWFLPGVVAFAALAVHAHRDRDGLTPPGAWPGTEAATLERIADDELQSGLGALHDRDRPISDRLTECRDGLERAETLLVRSLAAQPARADALAKLAAVRWELDPPQDASLALVDLASRRAPHDPAVQERLATLLVRIGRRDEAMGYVRRALDLDPDRARAFLALLTESGIAPSRVLRDLGSSPNLLVAARASFLELGHEEAWLDAVDSTSGPLRPDADLLVAYADSCLRTRAPERLLDGIERFGDQPEPRLESLRLRQRARAWLALGRHDAAAADAGAAVDLLPESAGAREGLGDVMAARGDHGRAVHAYRSAIEKAARGADRPRLRGRLYGKIGRSEEALGRTDPALDAYRLAVRLDPDQPIARRRLGALTGATGSAGL